jgi:serine/threonine protein kinase
MTGKILSHYKVLEELSQVGMGVVYMCEDVKLKRPVVLKFRPPNLTRDKEANVRFIYETQTDSAIDHQNICTIYKIDCNIRRMFVAMAYYHGEILKQKIACNLLYIEEVVDIAILIAWGLIKAYGQSESLG